MRLVTHSLDSFDFHRSNVSGLGSFRHAIKEMNVIPEWEADETKNNLFISEGHRVYKVGHPGRLKIEILLKK
jgi:hypothetical protein